MAGGDFAGNREAETAAARATARPTIEAVKDSFSFTNGGAQDAQRNPSRSDVAHVGGLCGHDAPIAGYRAE